MDIGEAVGVAVIELVKEVKDKCPFKDEFVGVDKEEGEHLKKDDKKGVQKEQHNSGGKLGDNLIGASPGMEGTVGGPFPPPEMDEEPRRDSKRNDIWVNVPGADGISAGVYPFTLAAHHLIPGKASLWPSQLKPYMTKNKSVSSKSGGQKWKIKKYIGYNVNGNHNGVWLPGNYAIRKNTSPTKKTWSKVVVSHESWCLNYVGAVTQVGEGQFHDTHTQYSEAVQKVLNKISIVLQIHQEKCDECKSKKEVNPPFIIKERLYSLSQYFKMQVTAHPSVWKRPWFTSDKWRGIIFGADKTRLTAFHGAYEKAARIIRLGTGL